MNIYTDRIVKTRQYLIGLIENLSVGEINLIPDGFNNNIAWNVGHMIASQQGICYVRSGTVPVVDEEIYLKYKPGTKPDKPITEDEFSHLKKLLISSIEQLDADYQTDKFAGYVSWATRYGVDIKNIDDACQFLMYHDGLHAGVITTLKKLVEK